MLLFYWNHILMIAKKKEFKQILRMEMFQFRMNNKSKELKVFQIYEI